MTNEEAEIEAIKRWGEKASVYFASTNISEGGRYTVYPDNRQMEEGVGNSWEEAFADVEKKKANKK